MLLLEIKFLISVESFFIIDILIITRGWQSFEIVNLSSVRIISDLYEFIWLYKLCKQLKICLQERGKPKLSINKDTTPKSKSMKYGVICFLGKV